MVGSALLSSLNISKGNYENLWIAILIRTVCRLLPIPFVYLLVPQGSSMDRTARFDLDELGQDADADGDREAGAAFKSKSAAVV